jgi:hypothetical protein
LLPADDGTPMFCPPAAGRRPVESRPPSPQRGSRLSRWQGGAFRPSVWSPEVWFRPPSFQPVHYLRPCSRAVYYEEKERKSYDITDNVLLCVPSPSSPLEVGLRCTTFGYGQAMSLHSRDPMPTGSASLHKTGNRPLPPTTSCGRRTNSSTVGQCKHVDARR